jgi:uncharacterized protein YkwD
MFKHAFRAAALAALLVGASGARANDDVNAAVLREFNFARMHPQEYAAQLREYRKTFEGMVSHDPHGPEVGVLTDEGIAAVDEAIAFMDHQKPLPPLAESPLLGKAALRLVGEQGPSGMIGHVTPASASAGDRLVAIGGQKYVAEVISYGYTDPVGAVRQLIIDDGEPRRGHRFVMFQPNFQYAGADCGAHVRFEVMCAIEIAEQADGGPTLPGSHPVILVTRSSKVEPTNVMAAQATPPVAAVTVAAIAPPPAEPTESGAPAPVTATGAAMASAMAAFADEAAASQH